MFMLSNYTAGFIYRDKLGWICNMWHLEDI